jgi:hypothetical protein
LLIRVKAYGVAKQGYYKRAYAKSKIIVGRQFCSDMLGCTVKILNILPRIGFNGAIALATIVNVGVSIGQWLAISHQLKQSRIEMTIANRPWLSVEAEGSAPSPLVFDKNGASGIVWLMIKNVGHSPAIHLVSQQTAIIPTAKTDIAHEEVVTCNKASAVRANAPYKLGGLTLVPDQVLHRYPLGIRIKASDIKDTIRNPIEGMRGFVIYAIVCFDYRLPWQNEDHIAPVAYEIDKLDKSSGPLEFTHFDGTESGPVTITVLNNPAYGREQN